jgi:hypothetical protein
VPLGLRRRKTFFNIANRTDVIDTWITDSSASPAPNAVSKALFQSYFNTRKALGLGSFSLELELNSTGWNSTSSVGLSVPVLAFDDNELRLTVWNEVAETSTEYLWPTEAPIKHLFAYQSPAQKTGFLQHGQVVVSFSCKNEDPYSRAFVSAAQIDPGRASLKPLWHQLSSSNHINWCQCYQTFFLRR